MAPVGADSAPDSDMNGSAAGLGGPGTAGRGRARPGGDVRGQGQRPVGMLGDEGVTPVSTAAISVALTA
jgi:hypothetical protein